MCSLQGANVKKPEPLTLDLRSVREPAQAYAMLSRVQALTQLFILEKVPVEKIYPSADAVEELRRLQSVAVNSREKTVREKTILASLNIRSLPQHIKDLARDHKMLASPVIALQETWCDPSQSNQHLQIPGYILHLTSVGRGKGIATYYRDGDFTVTGERVNSQFQMLRLSCQTADVINVYRSQATDDKLFLECLRFLVDLSRTCLVVGDFNLNYLTTSQHPVILAMKEMGLAQLVTSPTHLEGEQYLTCLNQLCKIVYYFRFMSRPCVPVYTTGWAGTGLGCSTTLCSL